MTSFFGKTWKWFFVVAVIAALGWFWFSWRTAPGVETAPQAEHSAPTEQDTITGLSAPSTITDNSAVSPAPLTPATSTAKAVDNAPAESSVLDSLTPKK